MTSLCHLYFCGLYMASILHQNISLDIICHHYVTSISLDSIWHQYVTEYFLGHYMTSPCHQYFFTDSIWHHYVTRIFLWILYSITMSPVFLWLIYGIIMSPKYFFIQYVYHITVANISLDSIWHHWHYITSISLNSIWHQYATSISKSNIQYHFETIFFCKVILNYRYITSIC